MKKLILLLLLLSIGFSIQAQDYWTEYATAQSAASTGMRSISIVDANVAWLSMSCGTTGCTTIRRYSKTTDAGLTWTTGVVDLGAASANLEIANIHGVSASVAFASVFPKVAGAIGGVWKTVDGGTTWTRQPTAVYNDAASFANIVYFWDANNGVTMGDPAGGYFEIYTTSNGGTNWTRVPSSPALIPFNPQDYGLTNQFTTNGNNIWIGTTFGRILRSSDKGLNWAVSQSPIPDFGGGINGAESGDLAFTSATNGLLQTSDYLLYSTSNAGATWSPSITYTGDMRNFGLAEIPGSPNKYISIGADIANSERGSSYTTDGGLNWTSINNNPDLNFVDGSAVVFLNINTGYAGGFSTSAAVGGIFKWNANQLATATFSNGEILSAYPNPTKGTFNLQSKDISSITVFDVLGKQIINKEYNALSSVSLDLSSYNKGIYLVKVFNAEGASSLIKVVKE